MSFLTINGFDVSIAKDACNVDDVEVGERARAYDGTARSTVRAFKREWKCTTTPNTAADADMLRGLLRGQAERWDWDSSDAYGSKGSAFVTSPSSYTTGGKWNTSGKYANFLQAVFGGQPGLTSTGTGFMSWWQLSQDGTTWVNWTIVPGGITYNNGSVFSAPTSGGDYPCFGWTNGTTTYQLGVPYYANNLLSGSPGTWAAGANYGFGANPYTVVPSPVNGFGYVVSAITTGLSGGSQPTWPMTLNATVVDGGVTWKCVGASTAKVDEFCLSTSFTPSASLVSAFATTQAAAYPKLFLSGDVVSNSATTVLAQVHSEHHLQYADASGTWQAGARTLEFTLQEV